MKLLKSFNKFINGKSNTIINLISYFSVALFTIVGIIVSLNRFWQYEVFYVDFGVYDQAIWEVSRFKPPIIEHFLLGEKWFFADHFVPSIFLISPFYWLTQRSEMILIVQAIAVGLSGLVLYQIGKHVLKNSLLSLSITLSYFLFVGLQNAVITEFHEITVMTLPLMLTFWAAVKKKTLLYFLFLIITLGFKEITFSLGIGIGIALFFINKDLRRIALLTILISIVWGIFSMKFMIPYFSGGVPYAYSQNIPESNIEKIASLLDYPLKRRTVFYSLFSFGFLPVLSPAFWPVIIQDYASRFLPKFFYTRWDLGMHYNAVSAVILGLSSIFSLKFIKKFNFLKNLFPVFSILIILNALILNRFILHGPFNLVLNPVFYKDTKNFAFLELLIKKVPANAVIMTQNNLAAKFTHQKVWLLQKYYYMYNPEYILIDNRSGQNPNDFFGGADSNVVLNSLKKDKSYNLIFNTKNQFLFKKT